MLILRCIVYIQLAITDKYNKQAENVGMPRADMYAAFRLVAEGRLVLTKSLAVARLADRTGCQ